MVIGPGLMQYSRDPMDMVYGNFIKGFGIDFKFLLQEQEE